MSTKQPITPEKVLRCDKCRHDISDLAADVAFTHVSGCDKTCPPALLVLCKANRCHLTENSLGSFPLEWFADPSAGLGLAVDATFYARLDSEHWQRWLCLLWAISIVATPKQKKQARECDQRRRA